MDVKTVCLGMLTRGEASGYDLKKSFESSFAHCFAAGFGSIYPALASLADQGLVSCQEVVQEGKPDRKVYRITEDGMQHLLRELDNPAPTHKIRSEFLVTMCFAHLMAPEQVQQVLDSRIEDAERNLHLIDEFENSCDEEWPVGVRFSLDFGRAMLRTMKEFVEKNRHMFTEEAAAQKRSATG
jgi:DNA-binding PadR family transcriptional regulator